MGTRRIVDGGRLLLAARGEAAGAGRAEVAIVNWHGCWGWLQVELCPRVEGNAIVVVSRREWLGLGRLRIPIPGWLKGRPLVREWQEPDGVLRIRVEIHNTLLGHFFGYEGRYYRVGVDSWQSSGLPSGV